MTGNKRTFTDQEKLQYLSSYRALKESENITIKDFTARAGLSKYTFTHWLYPRVANQPGALIRIDNPTTSADRISGSQISITYHDAVITVELSMLGTVLR
ncbi:MAG: hypothetical protein K9M84_06515, partial [Spirochaetia bacterium]|nr:hypothetical protein [Spirochaetia bacterium]